MSVQENPTVPARLVTAKDVWKMPEQPGTRLEISEGKLVELPGASVAHHLIVMAIVRLLDAFVIEHRLGYVFPDGVAYLLEREPDTLRIPDVSFMTTRRLSTRSDLEGYWHGAPDLAIEVVSANDNAVELHAMVQQYLDAGTRLVWVFWPTTPSVSVHLPDGSSKELSGDSLLEGRGVVPGFSLPVAAIFESFQAAQDLDDPSEE